MKRLTTIGILSILFLIWGLLPVQGQTLPDEKIRQIEGMILEKMGADGIPGLSIAVVVDGTLAWSKGYGLADLENNVPATPQTAYRSASIGKSITATGVMKLVEQDRLDLDAPVQRYCPAFPEKRWSITTRQLLGHMSGIRHYRNDEEVISTRHYDSVVEALDLFKDDTLMFEPGTAHLYTSYGYNLLGCVIEGASGLSFIEYMHRSVFQPTGMQHTRDDDPFAVIPNRAAGYRMNDQGERVNSYYVDMSNKMPAGGYITTAEDLASFAAAVMNGTLIKPATLEQMLTPQKAASGQVVPYGLGWGLFPDETWYGEREAFHGGGTPRVSGMLYLLPDRKFAVAILMNLEEVSERTGFAAQIAKQVLDLQSETKNQKP